MFVQGAGLGHGALPAAFTAAVFTGQACGQAAPVAAGLPKLGEDDSDGTLALGAPGATALVAPAVSWTPAGSSETAGTDSVFQVAQNPSTASCA
ncbi:hypothetical protein [Streptomyces flaveolus]|uniref:hypothetical protein n=1 Tax=Streptomyces flaveolus TaxID=67297 RepID=UPI0036F61593